MGVLPQDTLRDYKSLHDRLDWWWKKNPRRLRGVGADLLLSNIPYVSLSVARRIGLPAVAFSCLNWADMFGAYCRDLPGGAGIEAEILDAYRSVALFLRPAPTMPMTRLDNTRAIGPVGLRGQHQPGRLRQLLGGGERYQDRPDHLWRHAVRPGLPGLAPPAGLGLGHHRRSGRASGSGAARGCRHGVRRHPAVLRPAGRQARLWDLHRGSHQRCPHAVPAAPRLAGKSRPGRLVGRAGALPGHQSGPDVPRPRPWRSNCKSCFHCRSSPWSSPAASPRRSRRFCRCWARNSPPAIAVSLDTPSASEPACPIP